MIKTVLRLFLVVCTTAISVQVHAQGTAFTYQGRLNSNSSQANGSFDLRITLYNAASNGVATSGMVTNSAVVVSNGLFTTTMDFGQAPFVGAPEWLEIAVRTNGTGAFSTLAPRQPLTAVPYSVMAGSASNLLGTVPTSQLGGPISVSQLPSAAVTNSGTGVNLGGSFTGSFNGTVGSLSGGTWTNPALNYSYKSFYTNYTITPTDVVLNCTGTNQVITLLPAHNFPPSTLLTIWSDSTNSSVIITNATGSEAITVAGQGQGLAVLLGPANSPSNSVTLMVHGGHW